MIRYAIGNSGQIIVLSASVLLHFAKYRQNGWLKREAGGQLFAQMRWPEIIVEEATGPRRSDRRGRHFYLPDRNSERREIEEQYQRGLHYVGDWHTHPTPIPEASSVDSRSIKQCFDQSEHDLNGFILIIVGTAGPPRGLLVSVNDANGTVILKPQANGIESADHAGAGFAIGR